MKKTSLPLISFFLVIIMFVTLLAGCSKDSSEQPDEMREETSGTTETTESEYDEEEVAEEELPDQVVIKGFNWGWEEVIPEKDIVGKEFEKALGFKVIVEQDRVGSFEEVEQRLQLWASTGAEDWPDILFISPSENAKSLANQLGEAGILADFTPLLEKYSIVKEGIGKILPLVTNPNNGKIYMLPQNYTSDKVSKIDYGLWLRKDWLEKVQMPYPKTIDDFYTVLKAFKENITTHDGQSIVPYIAFTETWSSLYDVFFPEGKSGWYVDENGKAVMAEMEQTESLVNYLVFYNKLYKEGLLDKEAFTLKQGQVDEKASQGRAGALHMANWQITAHNDVLMQEDSNAMFVMPGDLYDPRISNQPHPRKLRLDPWTIFTVKSTADPKVVDGFMKFLEYGLTEEGTILGFWGVKDVHWELNEDGKVVDTPDCAERLQGDWSKRVHEGIQWYSQIYNWDVVAKYTAPTTFDLRPDIVESWNNFPNDGYFQGYDINPAIYVNPGEEELTKSVGRQDRFRQMVLRAVTSAGSEDEIRKLVEEWQDTERNMGYEAICEERTKSVQELLKVWKFE